MERDSSSALSCALAGGADTIVARATAPGRSALAIVRLSGPGVRSLAATLCDPGDFPDHRWRTRRVRLRDRGGEVIEEAVAISYPRPRSFTGEDMLELVVHGSTFVVEQVIASSVALGARLAEAGEFSRRAVANGKLDLVQAEAVRDLINAESAAQARNARLQLHGLLSARFGELRRQLVELLALVEASLDFGDHDVVVDPMEVEGRRLRLGEALGALEATEEAGRWLREGVRIAIVGAPNAGKSTLFNTLLGRDRAIVSDQPGTTRDVVEGEATIAGIRVVLADTAGLRSTAGEVEAEGVRRARAALAGARAAVVVWAVDGGENPPQVEGGIPLIQVRSKCDLGSAEAVRGGWLAVSCFTGEGVEELRAGIAGLLRDKVEHLGGEVAIAARHAAALRAAAAELDEAAGREPEVMAEHLRCALRRVEQMVGAVDDEEVLDQVFRTFCIGK
jgi:tRNA modification GTPase